MEESEIDNSVNLCGCDVTFNKMYAGEKGNFVLYKIIT